MARGLRFEHPVIQKMAKKYSKEPAQIFLRWGLQHGYIVIPKSASQKRIQSNKVVFDFEISAEDMEEVSCHSGSADGSSMVLTRTWTLTGGSWIWTRVMHGVRAF